VEAAPTKRTTIVVRPLRFHRLARKSRRGAKQNHRRANSDIIADNEERLFMKPP
jgi:hypothetical protein